MIDRDSARQDSSAPAGENRAAKPLSAPRRKILIAGGTVAPVVLTLISRPVLGGDCISPSATLSTALSHRDTKVGTCTGRSPGYWKNHTDPGDWPVPTTTTFYSFFQPEGSTHFYKTVGSTQVALSMLEVLQLTGGEDSQKMGAHFTAAYLAIKKGWVSPLALSETSLLAMWAEWATTGFYHPYAGAAPWDADQIKNYLINNHIAGD